MVFSEIWDSELVILNDVSTAPKIDFTVWLYPTVIHKIDKLLEMFNDIEWLSFLEGEIYYNKKEAHIYDLVLPESQSISITTVKDIMPPSNVDHSSIVGVIHSHHNMNASFSGTDDRYLSTNNDISIVVNNKKEVDATLRIKTETGEVFIVKVSVNRYVPLDDYVETEFEKEVKQKIKRPTSKTITNENPVFKKSSKVISNSGNDLRVEMANLFGDDIKVVDNSESFCGECGDFTEHVKLEDEEGQFYFCKKCENTFEQE